LRRSLPRCSRSSPTWYLLPAIVLALAGLVAAHRISPAADARPTLKRAIELTLAIQAIGCVVLVTSVLLGHMP